MVGSGLDDCFVLKKLVLKICQHHYCNKVAAVFGKANLWAYFDPCAHQWVPQEILRRVQREYTQANILDPKTNLFQKVRLDVWRYECQLFIEDLVVDGPKLDLLPYFRYGCHDQYSSGLLRLFCLQLKIWVYTCFKCLVRSFMMMIFFVSGSVDSQLSFVDEKLYHWLVVEW